jgi:IclR family acetate operon transcriptional repressor
MKSVETVLRLLEEVSVRQPVRVGELARDLDIPKSTAQRGLKTLEELGWVANDGDAQWRLTTKTFRVGSRYAGLDLRTQVMPVMREIWERTDENVHLAVRDGDHVTLIEKLDTRKAVRTFQGLGATAPLLATSTGKAIVAFLPEDQRERLLTGSQPAYTGTTITDVAEMRSHLDEIRERGYAVNRGEWRDDVTAVAAPVLDMNGVPVAAISVSSPAHRLTDDLVTMYGEMLSSSREKMVVG